MLNAVGLTDSYSLVRISTTECSLNTTSDCQIFNLMCDNLHLFLGTKGKTEKIRLNSWSNDFKEGHANRFTVKAMDVGEVLMIHLHNDGSGGWYKNPDWFVNKVVVINLTSEEPFEFPCYRWVVSDMVVFQGKGIILSGKFAQFLLKPILQGFSWHTNLKSS